MATGISQETYQRYKDLWTSEQKKTKKEIDLDRTIIRILANVTTMSATFCTAAFLGLTFCSVFLRGKTITLDPPLRLIVSSGIVSGAMLYFAGKVFQRAEEVLSRPNKEILEFVVTKYEENSKTE